MDPGFCARRTATSPCNLQGHDLQASIGLVRRERTDVPMKSLTKDMTELSRGGREKAKSAVLRVRELKESITASFYEMGEVLGRILDEKLYVALGYASFVELLEGEDLLGPTQAKKLIAVRRGFERDHALLVGPEKAYALARYAARTKIADSPGDLVTKGFPIGGRRTPVTEVPIRRIEEAGRAVVRRQTGGHSQNARARADAETEARVCLAAFRARGGEGVTVRPKFERGAWVLVIQLPAAQARGLLRVDVQSSRRRPT